MVAIESNVPVERVTREEISAELDRLSSVCLRMPGTEFMERWLAGGLDAFDPTVARLAVFAKFLTD